MLSFVMNNGIFFIKTYIYICDLYTFTCESGGVFLGTFIKYYKISQLIHTQSIAN